jgi:hypothetical protein
MSIHERLAAVAAELHLTGYGHDLNTAVTKIAHFFADEMHALTGGAQADVGEKLEALIKERLDELDANVMGALKSANEALSASIEEKVTGLFNTLLAKAAAADAPKGAADEPHPPAEATGQASDAPKPEVVAARGAARPGPGGRSEGKEAVALALRQTASLSLGAERRAADRGVLLRGRRALLRRPGRRRQNRPADRPGAHRAQRTRCCCAAQRRREGSGAARARRRRRRPRLQRPGPHPALDGRSLDQVRRLPVRERQGALQGPAARSLRLRRDRRLHLRPVQVHHRLEPLGQGGQRCRVVCAGNPPTRPEGLWVNQYWGAWLDPNHPNPAKPGELRWYVRGPNDEDIEVDGRGPHAFDWAKKPLLARSRTFIPSSLADNPDLTRNDDYEAMLDSLPIELQRAYRDGDFTVGISDDDWQVIPSAWIEAAHAALGRQDPAAHGR